MAYSRRFARFPLRPVIAARRASAPMTALIATRAALAHTTARVCVAMISGRLRGPLSRTTASIAAVCSSTSITSSKKPGSRRSATYSTAAITSNSGLIATASASSASDTTLTPDKPLAAHRGFQSVNGSRLSAGQTSHSGASRPEQADAA